MNGNKYEGEILFGKKVLMYGALQTTRDDAGS